MRRNIQLNSINKKINDFAQALPGIYNGSRDEKIRYMYTHSTLANFIELAEDYPLEQEDCGVELLGNVKGARVVTHCKDYTF